MRKLTACRESSSWESHPASTSCYCEFLYSSCKVPLLLALSFDFLAVSPSSTGPKDRLEQGHPELPQGHCCIPGLGVRFGWETPPGECGVREMAVLCAGSCIVLRRLAMLGRGQAGAEGCHGQPGSVESGLPHVVQLVKW